ncbi:MAG: hypothetical protein IT320_00320 [Anaerolineae bacterium]|nr:hypothetical protein [Anaerolineae bacterium]
MRKLSALAILAVVFFPLAFATMTMITIRPWVLDRGFYERLVSDERLYEGMLSDDFASRVEPDMFTREEQLPLGALSIALREVVSADYLRTQSLNVIDDVFDFVEGRAATFEVRLDITPIKTALMGEGRTSFAEALAGALPACADGQPSIAPGGHLTRCIAADQSVADAAEQIVTALPAALEDAPDQIVMAARSNIRTHWYDVAWFLGSGIHAVLDVAIMMLIAVTLMVGFVGAYLGGDSLAERLKWLSSSLFAPASLLVVIGLALSAPWTSGSISSVLANSRWNGVVHSDAYREAVASVVIPIVQQLGNGFLVTGFVVSMFALAVLVASWITHSQGQGVTKTVQVPVRNA